MRLAFPTRDRQHVPTQAITLPRFMDSFATYYLTALKLSRADFVAHLAGLFLVKAPWENPAVAQRLDYDDDNSNPFDDWVDTTAGMPVTLPTKLTGWHAARVAKTLRTPPFNRITAGRSRICDVALPYPSISKVHAEFHVEEQRVVRIADRNSKNGTFVNGQRVGSAAPAAVNAGDALRLGQIELRVMDAARLYELLHTFTDAKR